MNKAKGPTTTTTTTAELALIAQLDVPPDPNKNLPPETDEEVGMTSRLFAWWTQYRQQQANGPRHGEIQLYNPVQTIATLLAQFELESKRHTEQSAIEGDVVARGAHHLNPLFYIGNELREDFGEPYSQYLVEADKYLRGFGCLYSETNRQGRKVVIGEGSAAIMFKMYHLAGFLRLLLWDSLLREGKNCECVPIWFRDHHPIEYHPDWQFAHDCHDSYCYMYGHITYRPKAQNSKACNNETYLGHIFNNHGSLNVALTCQHQPTCKLPFQPTVCLVTDYQTKVTVAADPKADLLWHFDLMPVPLVERLRLDEFAFNEPTEPENPYNLPAGWRMPTTARDKFNPGVLGAGWWKLSMHKAETTKDAVGCFFVERRYVVGGSYKGVLPAEGSEIKFHQLYSDGSSYLVVYRVAADLYMTMRLRTKKGGKLPQNIDLTEAGYERLLDSSELRQDSVPGMTASEKNKKGDLRNKVNKTLAWMVKHLPMTKFLGKGDNQ